MKKISVSLFIAAALIIAGSLSFSMSVKAQTANMTPVFYSQSGTALNPSGSSLPAGYYYLSNGSQIYYYGNGTYYNPATQQYGGTAFGTASTQPIISTGLTPVFYSQTGQALNPSGSALSAGNYYLQNGDAVYYYGNGTYYDPTTQQYGGMAFGTTPVISSTVTTPGAPNTGLGGDLEANMIVLSSAVLAILAGSAYVYYLSRRISRRTTAFL